MEEANRLARRGRIIILIWLVVCPWANLLWGQGVASISGRVTDQSGAAVPNVQITATNEATGVNYLTRSTDTGSYVVSNLRIGAYTVTAEQHGFHKLIHTGVVVSVNANVRVDLSLKMGSLTQSVEVSATPTLLRTQDPALGTTILESDVQKLPLYNRRPGYLLAVVPTVRFVGEDDLSFGSPRFVQGGTSGADYVIDGVPATQNGPNPDQITIMPPLESVQEVRVDTSGLGATFGGGAPSGTVMTMVTKSGTNDFHGSLYEYARNEALDARSTFSPKKPLDRYHLFGGSVGGKIIKNKLFYFYNGEGTKQELPQSGLFTFPTKTMLSGDFSALKTTQVIGHDALGRNVYAGEIFDPATSRQVTAGQVDPSTGLTAVSSGYVRDAFQGNLVPASRFSQVAKNVIAFPSFTAPNLPGTSTGANNVFATWGNVFNAYRHTAKLDFNVNDKDALSYTWLYELHKFGTPPPSQFINPVTSNIQLETQHQTQDHIIGWTHIVSANLVNDLRFNYRPLRTRRVEPGNNPSAKYAAEIGIKNFSPVGGDIGFPQFNFSGYATLGPPFLIVNFEPQWFLTGLDTVTYVHGNHTLHFGLEVDKDVNEIRNETQPTGAFTFTPLLTNQPGLTGNDGNSIASFLLGDLTSASINDQGLFRYHEWMYDAFTTDTWKITPRLTLSLGLRWSVQAPIYEDLNNKITFFEPNAVNPVSGTVGALAYAGRNGYPRSLFDTNFGRFLPRVGFAYNLDSKTVIRGAYGLFTLNCQGACVSQNEGFAAVTAGFSTQDNGITPAFNIDSGFPSYPIGGTPTSLTPGFGAVPVGKNPIQGINYVDRKQPFSYLEDFNLSVQREIPYGIVLEVAGQGNLGRKMLVGVDRNQLPPSVWGIQGNLQALRPYPQYSSVMQFIAPLGTLNYYGLSVSAQRRYSHGWSLMANYSWSKSLGILSSSFAAPYAEYTNNPGLSYGPAVYNDQNGATGVPYQMASISGLWTLPFGPGKTWINSGPMSHIFGGWETSGILTIQGGIPFSLQNSAPSLNCDCGLANRLNLVGNLHSGSQTMNQWFNTSAVAAPSFGQIGTLGPGVLVGPHMVVLNFDLSKEFNIFRERVKGRFDAQFFNFTNTPVYGNPGNVFGTPTFGVVSGPGPAAPGASVGAPPWGAARIVQLGMHISW